MTYTITLTEEQMRVTQKALEQYFRLLLGQDMEFSDEICEVDRKEALDGPNHDQAFKEYLMARDHVREIMRAVFRIAFKGSYGVPFRKTDDMMIAECIWDAIKVARGVSRWGTPFQIGPEPVPKIVLNGKERGESK